MENISRKSSLKFSVSWLIIDLESDDWLTDLENIASHGSTAS